MFNQLCKISEEETPYLFEILKPYLQFRMEISPNSVPIG